MYREEEEPSSTNPYFYRIGNKIPFLGVEDVPITTVEVGLFTSIDVTDVNLDIDQAFDFPNDLIPVLKRQVLDMGIWVLNVPSDLRNDGADTQPEVPQKKFVSINDINEQS